ncbi:MAG: hypothetical protein WCH40_11200 [Verrucomicrobiales bacterium]
MKFKRFFPCLVGLMAAVLLPSCTTSCWEGGIPMRSGEVAAHRLAVADIQNAQNVVVYRGLAHPQKEKQLYAKQLRTVNHFYQHGFEFFTEPVAVPAATVKKVLNLYSDPSSHQTLSIKSLCHYHPDYSFVWKTGDDVQILQMCYGCHEWRHFCARGVLVTDINEPAYFDKLTVWLPKMGDKK